MTIDITVKKNRNQSYGRILKNSSDNNVVILDIERYTYDYKSYVMPNITNSEHDKIVLNKFRDIFGSITNETKVYYEENMFPDSEKPKKIHYSLNFNDKIDNTPAYSGYISFINKDGLIMKKMSLEQITEKHGFKIIKSHDNSFAVLYNMNNNPELKDIIIESLFVNGQIIRNIQHRTMI
jgi:hypothetical protein